MTLHKFLTISACSLGLVAFLLAAPGCSKKTSSEGDFAAPYDGPTDTDLITAERDEENDCLFTTEVDGLGTATLRAALVSASDGPTPAAATLSKDGGSEATAGVITPGTDGEEGWIARFTVSGIGTTSNGPVGTELDFDGTWSITLTMADGDYCQDVPEPLSLELIEED